MEKKLTKKDYYGMIRELVEGNETLVAFVDHEVELLSRKKGTETKAQKENKVFITELERVLVESGNKMTIKEIIGASDMFADFSGQKIVALAKKLIDAGKVQRVTEGKAVFYTAI